MEDPTIIFRDFLRLENIPYDDATDINQLVEKNYDKLSEVNLQSIVKQALLARDKNLKTKSAENDLLGSWGTVIDVVKEVTANRRQKAVENMQLLLKYDHNPIKLAQEVSKLSSSGQINPSLKQLFPEGIQSSINDSQFEFAAILKNIYDLICKVENGSNIQNEISVDLSSHVDKGNSITANQVNDIDNNNIQEQNELNQAGFYLRNLLADCAGDVQKLSTQIKSDYHKKIILPHRFLRVVSDNISACEQAGYVNKLKILQFIKSIIQTEIENEQLLLSDINNINPIPTSTTDSFTTYHAPKFIDNQHTQNYRNLSDILAPISFLDTSQSSVGLLKDPLKNNKKKSEKRTLQSKTKSMVQNIDTSLQQYGYAVCDNFIPLDLVRRVRIEASLFKSHYEQSEIWVGKEADVGAQLSVPSVRGDKVLWVCGGRHHNAVEGNSRTIRTRGEVEPCRLEVKAQAPIRKFSAMKELISACDGLIEELKANIESLSKLFDRSDAMLSIYPGGGARFANHIDNTTEDGRKLTVVFYLNPGWVREQGGALRVTDKLGNVVDVYPDPGRIILFYSSLIMHEVLPTFAERHAITIWYYDTEERKRAVEKAKEGGRSEDVQKAGAAAQTEAKLFIADLMGGDQVGEDGGEPTVEELGALAFRVRELSDAAVGIVASITGAPSKESFRTGFELLTATDLKSMRALFRRMGLH